MSWITKNGADLLDWKTNALFHHILILTSVVLTIFWWKRSPILHQHWNYYGQKISSTTFGCIIAQNILQYIYQRMIYSVNYKWISYFWNTIGSYSLEKDFFFSRNDSLDLNVHHNTEWVIWILLKLIAEKHFFIRNE